MIAKSRLLALLVGAVILFSKEVPASIIQTANITRYFASSEYWFIGEVVSGARSNSIEDHFLYRIEEIDGELREVSICTTEQIAPGTELLIAVSHSARASECGDDALDYSEYLNGVVALPIARSLVGSDSAVMLTVSEFGSLGCDVGMEDPRARPFWRGDLEWPPSYYVRRMLPVPVSVVVDCIRAYESSRAD